MNRKNVDEPICVVVKIATGVELMLKDCEDLGDGIYDSNNIAVKVDTNLAQVTGG